MLGHRLRLARKRLGLTQKALAKRLSGRITVHAISKYETGTMLPTSTPLTALAKSLGVSLDYLLSDRAEVLEGLEFRKHHKASARDRAHAQSVLIDHLERYLAIEEVLDLAGDCDWLRSHRRKSVRSLVQVENAAEEVRDAWGLGDDPIPSLCHVLEEKGLKVVEDDLPESIHGLACRVLRDGKPVADVVAVSGEISVERKRFTLAH